jgi:MFS family permease
MTDATITAGLESDELRRQRGKSATRGAFFGFFVDMFDIYLPVVALAPALGYFVSPEIDPATSSLILAVMFAATLVGRPLGAMIFGHVADRGGRKRATLIAVGGFGVLTSVIGILPGYEAMGMTAVVLFVTLRFVIGIFVGGEYTAAGPLAMESAPKEKRGLYGAVIMTGFPMAFVAMSLLTLLMLQIAPAGDLQSPYVQWGWRIPFFIGGLLSLCFCVYFARNVEESELFQQKEEGKSQESPLRTLMRKGERESFAQVFVLMTGFWLSLNTVSAILPGILAKDLDLEPSQVSTVLLVAFSLVPIGQLAAGILSQRIGRRKLMIGWSGLAGVLGSVLFTAILFGDLGFTSLVAVATLLVVLIVAVWGLATTYINERFRTGVRASGFGLGYSLAVVLPSFYAFYQGWLATFLPEKSTVIVLLVVACFLTAVGAAMGPETKDVDFHSEDGQ